MVVPSLIRRRKRVLDLFCCEGGISEGYDQAGFEVVGVDIAPRRRYRFEFHQADAFEFVAAHGHEFDAVVASPPCQHYSLTQRIQSNEHPDLIGPTRAALQATGLPYVIENVEAAATELIDPVRLCGAMFGLETYRHRLFEAGGGFTFTPPPHAPHVAPNAKMGRPVKEGEFMHVVGNFSGVAKAREVMGMPWASREGLREAVPPSYSKYIGKQLMAYLAKEGASRGTP